jgi:hypothetical protein
MQKLRRRVDQLEQAEATRRKVPDLMPALMLSYATPEEIAAWEAAGRPALDPAAWEKALDEAYAESG